MAHEFTACKIFGTRYSSLGKRIETSLPHGEADNARTVISDLNIFQLCDHLDLELEDEEAELDYLIENRKQFYNNHSYMEKKAIGKANDGPVFVGDTLYRRSNGEKYTVQEDGSITNASGKTKLKAPDLDNFIHFFPKKGDRIKNRRKVKPAAITLPKQDNPLVEGECKTRTPQEASRSAAKQREQARKEAAKTTEEEKQIVKEHYLAELSDKEILAEVNKRPGLPCKFWDYILRNSTDGQLLAEIDRRGIVVHLSLEKASNTELAEEIRRRDTEPLACFTTEALKYELDIRGELPPYTSLGPYEDADLADELRRRGYTVNATKTINL